MATAISFLSQQSPFRLAAAEARQNPSPVRGTTPNFPKYLAQRKGVYYFKRKVPGSLVRELGGQSQIWKSLDTTDFARACWVLAKEVAAFELRVTTVRLRMASEGLTTAPPSNVVELSEDMVPALVQRYYVHMLEREEQELREMRNPVAAEMVRRKADADEMLQYYEAALTCSDTSAVEETGRQLLAGEGLKSRAGSPVHTEFCEKLLEAEVAILREQRARLDGKKQPTPSTSLPIRLQPKLPDYLAVWASAKVRPLKTLETTSRMVQMWCSLMGDTPASLISKELVKKFRDKLMAQQLSAATIRNRLGLLRAVVNNYFEEMHIEGTVNPFHNIRVNDKGQHQRAVKDRRAFEMSELNTLYSTPFFIERHVPKGQVKEAGYWATLMAPFVGARIEEIAQMRLVDIEIINGIWTLRICDLDKETQALKTPNSFRRIPIHDELIKLGFLQYVCDLKRRGEKRLFPSLKCENRYRRWSNELGKWFGRFLKKMGMASGQLDYHAFRYNFKQRLTQCGVDDEVRDALVGHWLTKDKSGKAYMRSANRQYNFVALCNAMRTLRYAELDLSRLYVASPLEGVVPELFTR
ncbi:MAG: phage integrase [Herminiimonas sp.]|nr:phage integrase [Herminiimonas sp.]